jgi:hypothetical protein
MNPPFFPCLFLSQRQESLTLHSVDLISLLFSSNSVYSDSKYTAVAAVRSPVTNRLEGIIFNHAFGSRRFIAVFTKARNWLWYSQRVDISTTKF